MVRENYPQVHLISSYKNVGFAAGNNLALREAGGEYILLLNSDAYINESVVGKTLEFMEGNSKCGILGVKLKGEDGELQPSARKFPNLWHKVMVMTGIASKFSKSKMFCGPDYPWWDHSSVKKVGWVPGAYFLTRRAVIQDIGYLDERYFLYYEEVDFCLQAQKHGWDVIFFPHSEVIHLGGESSKTTKKEMTSSGKQLIHLRIKSEIRYFRKNYGVVHVILLMGFELLWKTTVFFKNIIIRKKESKNKREEALVILKLICSTLIQDHFGKTSS